MHLLGPTNATYYHAVNSGITIQYRIAMTWLLWCVDLSNNKDNHDDNNNDDDNNNNDDDDNNNDHGLHAITQTRKDWLLAFTNV